MLALGAFRSAFHSRPRLFKFASTLSSPHRRFLFTSPNSFRRPYTWDTRLWYRRDGTPRSKREGAIYVTLALLLWYPCHIAGATCIDRDSVVKLIHIRRINSYYQFDLSKPSDIVEYIFKITQLDFNPYGKKHGKLAREGWLYALDTFPEAYTYVRSQLEELRELTEKDDVNQDTTETARTAMKLCLNAILAIQEKLEDIEGALYIRAEYQKSDAKDLYCEIG